MNGGSMITRRIRTKVSFTMLKKQVVWIKAKDTLTIS